MRTSSIKIVSLFIKRAIMKIARDTARGSAFEICTRPFAILTSAKTTLKDSLLFVKYIKREFIADDKWMLTMCCIYSELSFQFRIAYSSIGRNRFLEVRKIPRLKLFLSDRSTPRCTRHNFSHQTICNWVLVTDHIQNKLFQRGN